jgi:hypothetical protein
MNKTNKIIFTALICIIVLVVINVALLTTFWYLRYYYVFGNAKSYAELNTQFYIKPYIMYFPPKCSDIKYQVYTNFKDVFATFNISEEDFAEWAEENNWELKHIDDEFIMPWNKNTIYGGYALSDGYYYRTAENKYPPRFTIAYDRKLKRAVFCLAIHRG